MEPDFSSLKFDKNQKIDSAALDVILGIRLELLSFVLGVALMTLSVNADAATPFLPSAFAHIPGLVMFAGYLFAFGCGAYGIWLLVDSLGWSGLMGGILIILLLVSYVRLILLIVVITNGFSLIGKSKYWFSLFGRPRLRTVQPLT